MKSKILQHETEKGIDYGVIWNMTRNDAIYRLDNSKLNDKGPLQI